MQKAAKPERFQDNRLAVTICTIRVLFVRRIARKFIGIRSLRERDLHLWPRIKTIAAFLYAEVPIDSDFVPKKPLSVES